MAITIASGTSRQSSLVGRMGEPLSGRIFGADFRSQAYSLGRDPSSFAQLFSYVRSDPVTVFNPISNALEQIAADAPIFVDPRGRHGLYLSSVQGALLAQTPTGATTYSNVYASNRDNVACILEVFSAPGGWLKASGDIAATFLGDALEGGRFRHVYLTLRPSTTRNITVEHNDKVKGWKLSLNPFEEFGGTAFGGGAGAVPTLSLSAAALAGLNAQPRFTLRGLLRALGHRGGVGTWGKSLSIEDASGNGVQIAMNNGAWTLISTQAVAAGGQSVTTWTMPVGRYLLAEGRSEDLAFTLSVEKAARTMSLKTGAGRSLSGIPLPVMGAITTLAVGRHGSNSPKMALDYLAANTQ